MKGGKEKTTRIEVSRVVQTKIGSRKIDRPGARRFRIVAMKLKAAIIEEMPSNWAART